VPTFTTLAEPVSDRQAGGPATHNDIVIGVAGAGGRVRLCTYQERGTCQSKHAAMHLAAYFVLKRQTVRVEAGTRKQQKPSQVVPYSFLLQPAQIQYYMGESRFVPSLSRVFKFGLGLLILQGASDFSKPRLSLTRLGPHGL